MALIRLLTDFDGRIGPRAFWLGSVLVALALLAVEQFSLRLAGTEGPALTAFAGAFALFPWAAIAAKRANDRGRPKLYGIMLVCLIVLLGLGEKIAPAPFAPLIGQAALLLWLVALVDLGLMPGRATVASRLAPGRALA